jgi:hypothetical protein
MKKLILSTIIALFTFCADAQFTGASFDTLTHNSDRDEVSAQHFDIDNTGSLYIVYQRADTAGGWNLFFRKRIQGFSWEPEVSVSTQKGFNPALAVNKITGTSYVAYESDASVNKEIVLCSDSGGVWNCSTVSTSLLDDIYPSVAVDTGGSIHLAWIGTDSAGAYKIMYATNASGTWNIQELTASQLGQFGSGAAPQIATDEQGAAHIVYRGGNSGSYKIHHAFNTTIGGTIWGYDYITTPNAEDFSAAITVGKDTVVRVLISGNDGFGFPNHAYFVTKPYTAVAFDTAMAIAPGFSGTVGDIFTDSLYVSHFVLNEVSGNIYTGNVIYATDVFATGSLALNSADTYNANFVLDRDLHGFISAYQGNTFATEEVIVYGYIYPLNGISTIKNSSAFASVYLSSDGLHIKFMHDFKGEITLSSMDGKMIKLQGSDFSAGQEIVENNLAAGIYIIDLSSHTGTQKIKFTMVN